jgi:hypothetical protein
VDHNDVRLGGNQLEGMAYRILSPASTGYNGNGFRLPFQIIRGCGGKLRRQRNHDVGDGARLNEGIDAALEDGAAGEPGHLLRLVRPEAEATSASGNDGCNVSLQEKRLY